MKQITYVLKDPLGIHARPAGQMVKIASGCKCDITIGVSVGTSAGISAKTANAKRIIGVMTLGAKQGDEITLVFSGEDEEKAAAAIKDFLAKNL